MVRYSTRGVRHRNIAPRVVCSRRQMDIALCKDTALELVRVASTWSNPKRLHDDRTDDRRRNHWHSGGDRASPISIYAIRARVIEGLYFAASLRSAEDELYLPYLGTFIFGYGPNCPAISLESFAYTCNCAAGGLASTYTTYISTAPKALPPTTDGAADRVQTIAYSPVSV